VGRHGTSSEYVAWKQKGGDLAGRSRRRDLQHERSGPHDERGFVAVEREADALASSRADLACMYRKLGQGRVERRQDVPTCDDAWKTRAPDFLDIGLHNQGAIPSLAADLHQQTIVIAQAI
jgi:hypothetical protein